MATKVYLYEQFSGGWSIDPKLGQKYSQSYTQSFDHRKSPSRLSVLPGLQREDNHAVTDLVQNEAMGPDGTIWSVGSAGNVYGRSTSAVWSGKGNIGELGGFGIDYRKDTDDIYIAGQKSVARFEAISTAPALLPGYYGSSYSTYDNSSTMGFNVAAYQSGSTQTYSVPTALAEDATDLRYFQSDIEPLNKISVYILAKGIGNWTLTLHDGTNKVLGTATVTNANLNNTAWNDFVFSSAPNGQVRIYVSPNARTYHIHVTSTVNDGTLSCTAINDLSTCDLEVWADRLVVTNNGMHPIDRFLQYEVIGNGPYLSVWEPISDPPTNTEWQRHKLTLPWEYECCGVGHTNEYEVGAFGQSTTATATSGLTQQEGLLIFWDGSSTTYNYFVVIPEGTPYALHTYNNIIYYYAGGDWYEMTSPTTLPVKIWHLPKSDTEFSGANAPVILYPYVATTRRGIQLLGYPSLTTNTSIPYGVYSWGSVNRNFPESFSLNYLLSTGSQNYSNTNNLQIGMVKAFGDILHVSWRDSLNGNYGVDSITNATPPAVTAIWQGLIFDAGYAGKLKEADYVECYFNLPAGATIQLGYSINRGAFVTDTNLYSTTTIWQGRNGYARFSVAASNQPRFYEIQPQIIITSNGVTTPAYIYMIGIVYDDLKEETRK